MGLLPPGPDYSRDKSLHRCPLSCWKSCGGLLLLSSAYSAWVTARSELEGGTSGPSLRGPTPRRRVLQRPVSGTNFLGGPVGAGAATPLTVCAEQGAKQQRVPPPPHGAAAAARAPCRPGGPAGSRGTPGPRESAEGFPGVKSVPGPARPARPASRPPGCCCLQYCRS